VFWHGRQARVKMVTGWSRLAHMMDEIDVLLIVFTPIVAGMCIARWVRLVERRAIRRRLNLRRKTGATDREALILLALDAAVDTDA
jgi:hypothetical protein